MSDEFSNGPNLEQLRLELENNWRLAQEEAQTKRYQYDQGVKKVIWGTAVVAIAAAAFPFMQEVAKSTFSFQTETSRQNTEIVILQEQHRLELERIEREHSLALQRFAAKKTEGTRDYFERIANEARSDNIEKRINIAEFFSFLAETDGRRKQWERFREHLYVVQKNLNKERQSALETLADTNATVPERNAAHNRLYQIGKREAPSRVQSPVVEREISRIVLGVTEDVSIDALRKIAQDLMGWSDIGEHFVVRKDGTVETGRPIRRVPAFVYGHNYGSVGIGVACDTKAIDEEQRFCDVTEAQQEALLNLLVTLVDGYNISDDQIFGRKELVPERVNNYLGSLVSELRGELLAKTRRSK
ncbi:lysozyme [Roseibium album]|nr:lysozyme [Roseibium album]